MNPYNLEPQQMPVISIDFDGCIVEDMWPEIGPAIPGAVSTINAWYDAGYWIIINSCRKGVPARFMREWLNDNGVKTHAINENLVWRVCMYGTDPRKIGADIYIDDHNIERSGIQYTQYVWERHAMNMDAYTKCRAAMINANM